MKNFLLLILDDGLILLILSLCVIIFGVNSKLWVKSNKLIFLILILSVFMIGGNTFPIWWRVGAKHYNFIYNLGFSILTAFLFYWLTVIREEEKKREYYSFYSLNFLLQYYNLLSHFYLRELFSELRKERREKLNKGETEIKFTKIKIDIPCTKIFEIIKGSKEIVEKILNEYKSLDIEIEKNRKEMFREIIKGIKVMYKEEDQEQRIKNAIKDCNNSYSKENIFIYKIYKKICERKKGFEEELSYYSSLGNFEEIDVIRTILNYSKENLNGSIDEMEYFIKNYKYITPKLLSSIKKNIEVLKSGKRFIPSITLFLTPFNFGILDEEVFYQLIIYFYKENSKFYYDFKTETKKKILNIIKESEEYYFELEGERLKINTLGLSEISLEKNEVIIN